MLRIVHAHNRYRQPGGEDRVVESERALLENLGCRVIPFDVSNAETLLGATVQMSVSPWNPSSYRRFKSVVRSTAPDVVHIHNTWFALSPSSVSASRSQSLPTVMTLHNYRITCAAATLFRDGAPCHDCVGRAGWAGIRHRCYRDSATASLLSNASSALLRGSDRVTLFAVLTQFAADLFCQAGIPQERIRVVPNFTPDPGARVSAPAESDRVLFVGRDSPEKGLDLLIDAWTRSGTELRLTVVGPSNPTRAAPPGVEFMGRLSHEQTIELMLESRALVFPSQVYEGQPMVLLEAMAAGLPIVASDWPPIADTVGPGGYLVPAGAIDQWTNAVSEIESGKWLDSDSTRGRQRYEAHHSPAVAGHRLMKLYEEAIQSGP